MSGETMIGIIGGSGLYQIDGLTDVAWRPVASSFGARSKAVGIGS